MIRVSNVVAMACAIVGLAATAPSAALAQTWSAPQPITSGAYVLQPDIAIDGAGVRTAVVVRHDGVTSRVQASPYSGGAWGAGPDISPAGLDVSEPRIVANASGTRIAIWKYTQHPQRGVGVAVQSGGVWGSPALIAPYGTETNEARVTLNASGEGVAVWYRHVSPYWTVQASRYSGGVWSPAANLSSGMNVSGPQVAIDSSGTATVVWFGNGSVWVSRDSGSGWSAPYQLAAGQSAKVGVDGSGTPMVVWYDNAGTNTIRASRYVSGAWTTPQAVSAVGQAGDPELSVNAAGVATVAWQRPVVGGAVIMANRYSGGAWGTAMPLTSSDSSTSAPQVTMDSTGDATVVWTRHVSSTRVEAARFSGGAWGAPQLLSSASLQADQSFKVASDNSGGATVVWQSNNGPAYTPLSSTFSTPPPAPVPTLSEWAMILLGLVLAGVAAVTVQRRRRMA